MRCFCCCTGTICPMLHTEADPRQLLDRYSRCSTKETRCVCDNFCFFVELRTQQQMLRADRRHSARLLDTFGVRHFASSPCATREIRQSFLSYFAKHDHRCLPSSKLIPAYDNSLFFTNAGMVQFKACFMGAEEPPHPQVATIQKCVRAGGKHNDLDNVGHTARHHTFFEVPRLICNRISCLLLMQDAGQLFFWRLLQGRRYACYFLPPSLYFNFFQLLLWVGSTSQKKLVRKKREKRENY